MIANKSRVEVLFKRFDSDGDGVVPFEVFKAGELKYIFIGKLCPVFIPHALLQLHNRLEMFVYACYEQQNIALTLK